MQLMIDLPDVVLDWLNFFCDAEGNEKHDTLNKFVVHIVLDYLRGSFEAEAGTIGLKRIAYSGILELFNERGIELDPKLREAVESWKEKRSYKYFVSVMSLERNEEE